MRNIYINTIAFLLALIAGAPAHANQCANRTTQFSIYFTSEATELTSQGIAVADQAVKNINALTHCNVDTIIIEGHADFRESKAVDPRLSLVRALSVADILFQRGVSTDRVTISGHGSREHSKDEASGPLQRRVEIVITMSDKS